MRTMLLVFFVFGISAYFCISRIPNDIVDGLLKIWHQMTAKTNEDTKEKIRVVIQLSFVSMILLTVLTGVVLMFLLPWPFLSLYLPLLVMSPLLVLYQEKWDKEAKEKKENKKYFSPQVVWAKNTLTVSLFLLSIYYLVKEIGWV